MYISAYSNVEKQSARNFLDEIKGETLGAPFTANPSLQLGGGLDSLQIPHFTRLVEPDPAASGRLKPGKIVPLHPAQMNPGFIDTRFVDPGREKLDILSKGLQPCLEDKLKTWYPGFLDEKKPGKPSPCDRVRVALVNLSGEHWFEPELALWGGTYPMEAASVAKLLVVYALFQLRFDLRVLAYIKKITDSKKLRMEARASWTKLLHPEEQPKLEALFAWDSWDGKPDSLSFNQKTQQLLDVSIRCDDNCAMGRLIVHLGFPFIGSVSLQSGLWEPLIRGGLWISASFASKPHVKKGCPAPESCAGVIKSWNSNPVRAPKPIFAHNATALSVATFYTLLAQYRLVDPQSSIEIQQLLGAGCVSRAYRENIRSVAAATKCGILPEHRYRLKVYGCKDSRRSAVVNDSALFLDTRATPARRYILVVMSYPTLTPPWSQSNDYGRLVGSLEALLRLKAEFGDAC